LWVWFLSWILPDLSCFGAVPSKTAPSQPAAGALRAAAWLLNAMLRSRRGAAYNSAAAAVLALSRVLLLRVHCRPAAVSGREKDGRARLGRAMLNAVLDSLNSSSTPPRLPRLSWSLHWRGCCFTSGCTGAFLYHTLTASATTVPQHSSCRAMRRCLILAG